MPDLVEAASAILAQAQRRTEIAGLNIANSTTPAYKRRVLFSSLLQSPDPSRSAEVSAQTAVDFRPGKVVQTGNPYDLAITSPGFFALRQEDTVRFSRAGRFTRREDGRLVDALGGVLQLASGSDVVVNDADFEVRPDGRILLSGAEAGQIAVYATEDPADLSPVEGGFSDSGNALALLGRSSLVQGAYEASNVSNADEMVAMMQALRTAEAGQRMMITYDDLMGRVISTFGDNVK